MVMSMTGYGNHTTESKGVTVIVEIRTVNSRYLDFVPKMPHSFNALENDIKHVIKQYFSRGRIELYLSATGSDVDEKTLSVNWNLLDQYVTHLEEAKVRYNLEASIPYSSLTDLEGLFQVNKVEKDYGLLKEVIIETIEKACSKAILAREKEGSFLFKDIKTYLDSFQQMLNTLSNSEETIINTYRKKIEERIHHYINEQDGIQTERLYQEIALLSEKGNISEEITRLYSHIKQFNVLTAKEGPIGRQLDFIIQEMHREINTIGAKSVDPLMSKLVVSMKSDIEKIKEQVQNIE